MKTNYEKKMISLLFLLIPFISIGQTKNVIATNRVFPKVDKQLQFEKALAIHAKKFHTGDVTWRVFEIASGPDAGGFHISEGPKSWESKDVRGDINVEHNNDWHKNVTPFLTERYAVSYAVFIDSLSTIAIDDYADKMQITHIYPKPGCTKNMVSMLVKLKKAWEAEGNTIAVFQINASGVAQYAIVTRYKKGLKEKADGFRKPFKETYENIYGAGSYDAYLEVVKENMNDSWSELLFFRKDLSSD
jgi:hypothetical protein